MEQAKKPNSLEYLSSICTESNHFRTKFAIFSSTDVKRSPFVEIFILCLEYLQLVSQIILLSYDFDQVFKYQDDPFFNGILYAAKLINPSQLFPLDNHDGLTTTVLSIVLIIWLLKFVLWAFIFVSLIRNFKIPGIFKPIWRFIFTAQGRVIYFFMTSFWTKVIRNALQDNFNFFGFSKETTIALCAILIIYELGFSAGMIFRYYAIIPNGSLLSSKDNVMDLVCIFHKFSLQLIQMLAYNDTLARGWILVVVNALICFTRDAYFLRTLPLYNYRGLIIQGVLMAVHNSLGLSFFFQVFVYSTGSDTGDFRLAISMGIVLSIVSIQLCRNILRTKLMNLAIMKTETSSKLLIHKIVLIKRLLKTATKPSARNDFHTVLQLYTTTMKTNISSILSIAGGCSSINFSDKEALAKVFIDYLEGLSLKYPKNNYIKLYMASLYAKKLRLYGKSMQIIASFKQENYSTVILNASMLLRRIQKAKVSEYKSKDDAFNLYEYAQSQAKVAQLKLDIIKQAEEQIKVYQELVKDAPNLADILDCSQKSNYYRKCNENKIANMLQTVPESFITPYLLYACYYLELEFSTEECRKYLKVYYRNQAKYEKYFKNEALMEENLYDEKIAFALLSTQKSKIGSFVYYSQSLEKMIGGDANSYLGKTIYDVLTFPITRDFYEETTKKILDTNDTRFFKKHSRGYMQHQDGYMVETDLYMNFHPFINQEFLISLILRKAVNNKEHMMINENGDIEGATKIIGRKLGIRQIRNLTMKEVYNVTQISTELVDINKAFNIVSNPDKFLVKPVVTATTQDNSQAQSPNLQQQQQSPMKIKGRDRKISRAAKNHVAGLAQAQAQAQAQVQTPEVIVPKEMNLPQATRISTLYSTDGGEITLNPVKKENQGAMDASTTNPLVYFCKVSSLQYGALNLRLLTLEESRVTSKKDLIEQQPVKTITLPTSSPRRTRRSPIQPPKFEQNDISSYFVEQEDEKQEGWIDFNKLLKSEESNNRIFFPSSEKDGFFSNRLTSLTTNRQEDVLSPTSFRPLLTTTNFSLRNVITPQRLDTKHLELSNTAYKQQSIGNLPSQENQALENTKPNIELESAADSQKSIAGGQSKVHKLYRAALEVKYYSNTFKILAAIIALFVLIIFFCELSLNLVLNNSGKNLTLKKDILTNAQLRTYYLSNIQSTFRQIWDVGTGRIQISELGLVGKKPIVYIGIVAGFLPTLVATNEKLVESANLLDDNIRNSLFEKDVRVYDTDIDRTGALYMDMTSFQGTVRVIETTFRGIALAKIDVNLTENEYSFILRNAINDIFVKNDEISALFLASSLDQVSSIQSICTKFAITICMLLLGCAAFLVFTIVNNYRSEKENLIAFTKINTTEVGNIMARLSHFKQGLEEDYIDKAIIASLREQQKRFNGNYRWNHKHNEFSRDANHSGILRKHVMYSLRAIFYIAILIGLVAASSAMIIDSLSYFSIKQTQLDFANRMNTRTNLAMITSQELPIGNGTTLIKNVETEIGIFDVINDIILLQTEVTNIIVKSDLVNNPQIQQILYEDGCSLYEDSILQYCTVLYKKGIKPSLIQLLALLESYVVQRKNSFFDGDRSAAALKAIQLQNYDTLVAIKRVLSGGSTTIASIIDSDFEDHLVSYRSRRNMFFAILSVVLLVVFLLVWFTVLRQLKEVHNQFKKVLQTLPSNLILSSFLLKTFLMKSSHGTFDSVKSEL